MATAMGQPGRRADATSRAVHPNVYADALTLAPLMNASKSALT